MNLNLRKLAILGFLTLLSLQQVSGQDYRENEEEDSCVCENEPSVMHVHFSSQDVDLYEATPDTVYQNADWPSRIEEYSDYLSH